MLALNTTRRILLLAYGLCIVLATFVVVPWHVQTPSGRVVRLDYAPVWVSAEEDYYQAEVSTGQVMIEVLGLTILFAIFIALAGPIQDETISRLVKKRPKVLLLAALTVVILIFAILAMPNIQQRMADWKDIRRSAKLGRSPVSDQETLGLWYRYNTDSTFHRRVDMYRISKGLPPLSER